jgi:hypothetical protein
MDLRTKMMGAVFVVVFAIVGGHSFLPTGSARQSRHHRSTPSLRPFSPSSSAVIADDDSSDSGVILPFFSRSLLRSLVVGRVALARARCPRTGRPWSSGSDPPLMDAQAAALPPVVPQRRFPVFSALDDGVAVRW